MEIIEELTEQEYQLWKRGPIARLLFQFLSDKAVDYREGVFQAWEAGHIELGDKGAEEARVRMVLCNELNALTLRDIKSFYEQQGIRANEQQRERGTSN